MRDHATAGDPAVTRHLVTYHLMVARARRTQNESRARRLTIAGVFCTLATLACAAELVAAFSIRAP